MYELSHAKMLTQKNDKYKLRLCAKSLFDKSYPSFGKHLAMNRLQT
jgi:hypothetical protein